MIHLALICPFCDFIFPFKVAEHTIIKGDVMCTRCKGHIVLEVDCDRFDYYPKDPPESIPPNIRSSMGVGYEQMVEMRVAQMKRDHPGMFAGRKPKAQDLGYRSLVERDIRAPIINPPHPRDTWFGRLANRSLKNLMKERKPMLITKELLNLFAPDGKCCEDFLEKWEGKELTIASVAEAYCGTADEVNWLLEVKRKQYCVGTSVNERLHNDLHGIKDFLLQIQKSLNEKPKTFKLALNTDDHPSRHIHADHYLNAWQWLDFHGMQGVNRYVPLPMKEKLQAKIELEVNRKGSIPAKELAPILLEWLETGQTEVNRRDK